MSGTIQIGTTGGQTLFSTSGVGGNGTPATGYGSLYYGSDNQLRLIDDAGIITDFVGSDGNSGSSGNSGSNGLSGNSGSSGTSGQTGNPGTSGTSGQTVIGPTGATGGGWSYGGGSITTNIAGSLDSSALAANTTGSGNLAIGQNALNSNTFGFNNVAIGYNTSTTNISGYNNIKLGAETNNFLTTGYENVQLGVLNFIFGSGSGNVTCGTECGVGSISVSKNENTCIGWRNTSLGNNNTQIGNVIVGATGSNRTQIGQNFTSQGLDDAIVLGSPHDCIIHSSYIQSGTYSSDKALSIKIQGTTYKLLLST